MTVDGIDEEISQLGGRPQLRRFIERFSSVYKNKNAVITALALTNYSVLSEGKLEELGIGPEVEKLIRFNASLITRFTTDK